MMWWKACLDECCPQYSFSKKILVSVFGAAVLFVEQMTGRRGERRRRKEDPGRKECFYAYLTLTAKNSQGRKLSHLMS